jgi:hypothetical protein
MDLILPLGCVCAEKNVEDPPVDRIGGGVEPSFPSHDMCFCVIVQEVAYM